MARQKKPSFRVEFDSDDNEQIIDGDTSADGAKPPAKVRAKQQDTSPEPDSGSGPQDPPKPPIINKYVRVGTKRYASPLAATAIARFERKERNPQLAEFYVYRDRDVNGRGFI